MSNQIINGVKIINLKTHKDNRGYFREIFKFSEEFNDLTVGQLSHSFVNETVVKCWHGHVYQSQWNYVISGKIKVVLFDDRKESITYKRTIDFLVGDISKPVAYFFPPGVLHGYKCIEGPMQIIYVTTGVYDIDEEIRKDNCELAVNYNWQ